MGMASAGIRRTCSHYKIYTWVAKMWEHRKKRLIYIAGKSGIAPKEPIPVLLKWKGTNTDKSQNKEKRSVAHF